MDEVYEAYFTLLGKIGELLERLTELAKTKNIAAQRGDVLTVNECVKEEQGIGLNLRRMDQQRTKLLTALGLTDVTLSRMPERCPPNQRSAARAASQKLITQYNIFRSAADAARSTLEISLHNIEKRMDFEAPSASGNQSTSSASVRRRAGTFTDFRT